MIFDNVILLPLYNSSDLVVLNQSEGIERKSALFPPQKGDFIHFK